MKHVLFALCASILLIPSAFASFSCSEDKSYCNEMTSCSEAQFYMNECGYYFLDGDSDGIPCEKLCWYTDPNEVLEVVMKWSFVAFLLFCIPFAIWWKLRKKKTQQTHVKKTKYKKEKGTRVERNIPIECQKAGEEAESAFSSIVNNFGWNTLLLRQNKKSYQYLKEFNGRKKNIKRPDFRISKDNREFFIEVKCYSLQDRYKSPQFWIDYSEFKNLQEFEECVRKPVYFGIFEMGKGKPIIDTLRFIGMQDLKSSQEYINGELYLDTTKKIIIPVRLMKWGKSFLRS